VSTICLLALLSACGGEDATTAPSQANVPPTPPPQSPPSPPEMGEDIETEFSDVSTLSGMNVKINNAPLTNQEIPLIFSHGVAAGDYDNDGDIDIFITKADRTVNHLFQNMGNMAFEDVAIEAGVAYTRSDTETYYHGSPAFVDLNGDRNLDLLIPGLEQEPTLVFLSNGDGTFSNQSSGTGLDQMTASYSHSPAFGFRSLFRPLGNPT